MAIYSTVLMWQKWDRIRLVRLPILILLNGWPDPNSGWIELNTTRLARNSLKVSADGSVIILGVGRRPMTTSNAY